MSHDNLENWSGALAALFKGGGDASYAAYRDLYRRIEALGPKPEFPSERKLRLAFLSSFTIDPVIPYFSVCCYKAGLFPEFYSAPYGAYSQALLDPAGELYRFSPDLAVLAADLDRFVPDLNAFFFDASPAERKVKADEIARQFEALAAGFCANCGGLLLIHNFARPAESPLGLLDTKTEFGLDAFVTALNTALYDTFRANPRVYVLNYDQVSAEAGRRAALDENLRFLGQIRISPAAIPALCRRYMGYIKAARGLNRKCVVLDLDNTLWGGTVGEDPIEALKLGPTAPGNSYVEFQRVLFGLSRRGIILAVNSKNNYKDSIKVIREHPHMVLREKDFAAIRINWNDKVANIREISRELNIGLQSMVFIDDLAENREMMRQMLPEVLTPELPATSAFYAAMLAGLEDLESISLTSEDIRRNEMYAQNRQRTELKGAAGSVEEYLRSLEMVAEVKPPDAFTLPRVAQLTQRTNQFNLTTRRYTEGQIADFSRDPGRAVYALRLADKFGDNGIVGAAIVVKDGKRWEIDSFLLSCRVIGRGAEKYLLAHIAAEAAAARAVLRGIYIPTPKNSLVRDFYPENGFSRAGGANEYELAPRAGSVPFPVHIKLSPGTDKERSNG